MKVLVIEDERKVASFVKRGLEENDYNVEIAYDGLSGLDELSRSSYDLVILDVNIPVMNGINVCRKIRETMDLPVLMLTALGSLEDKINGLDAGADDYLLKPFEFKELLARMRALERRAQLKDKEILSISDLTVDLQGKTVKRGNKIIDLTAKEYYLLEYLIRNRGKVVTRNEISENVWNINFNTGTNIIDVYINYLRKKIDKDFFPKLIHTLVGIGYVLKIEKQE